MKKEVLLYIFFGAATTAVNTAVYVFLYDFCAVDNTAANIAAWILSVLFAFFTNRKWVFESEKSDMIKEAARFFAARSVTGVIDLTLMYLTVDICRINGDASKIGVNIVVIVFNYFFSKFWIFRN